MCQARLARLRGAGQLHVAAEDHRQLRDVFDGHRQMQRPRGGEAREHGDVHARQHVAKRTGLRLESNSRQRTGHGHTASIFRRS